MVKGSYFIARDLTVQNTANTANSLDLALDNRADNTTFYNCKFISHYATIYAERGHQLYSDCKIVGTNFFIYGSVVAVYQNCNIIVKKNIVGSAIISRPYYTKVRSLFDKGFVFDHCEFGAINSSTTNFLGVQLFDDYPIAVVMRSYLDASIAGWIASNSSRCYFVEYNNYGPGSITRNNNPSCVQFINDSSIASQFTIKHLLKRETWTKYVPCELDL